MNKNKKRDSSSDTCSGSGSGSDVDIQLFTNCYKCTKCSFDWKSVVAYKNQSLSCKGCKTLTAPYETVNIIIKLLFTSNSIQEITFCFLFEIKS